MLLLALPAALQKLSVLFYDLAEASVSCPLALGSRLSLDVESGEVLSCTGLDGGLTTLLPVGELECVLCVGISGGGAPTFLFIFCPHILLSVFCFICSIFIFLFD